MDQNKTIKATNQLHRALSTMLDDAAGNLMASGAVSGARFTVNGAGYIWLDLVCNGEDRDMGYWCSMPPEHKGQCWTSQKKVNFIPVRY